MIFQEILTLWL